MAVIKCKMCGGDIDLSEDKTFGTCEYCGSTMTFPKVDSEQRAAAFNRGNHFRRIGEFDKALAVYESIVREDDTDAEAHWCCALCRFGIEYVEDPSSYEWLPTCHRASFDSFLEDVDYLAALEHSEGVTKRQYQKDGAKIAEVQKGILATSQNEEPFDVFICYKESDDNGNRTVDSTLAQDIYYQLTDQGYRVFFSRITLEDKVGTEYEPYIFAALQSAKVMVAVGTKPEYYNAVWVKNEWSRFLALMKHDRKKLLLPCYRDMNPYDMPESLSVLQSYDMGKIGFVQDLIRGISKVIGKEEKKEKQVEPSQIVTRSDSSHMVQSLVDRGYMALEDSKWDEADGFFEQALNQDSRCAKAYLGKMLRERQLTGVAEMIKRATSIDDIGSVQEQVRLDYDNEIIKAAIEQYVVPGYLDAVAIKKSFLVNVDYQSKVSKLEEKCRGIKEDFDSDKNYARALQFATEGETDEFQNIEKTIYDFYASEIEKEKQRDAASIERINKEYEEKLNQEGAKELYQQACLRKEKDYQAICDRMENLKKENSLPKTQLQAWSSLANSFEEFKDYKDSEKKRDYCIEKKKEYEIRVQKELKRERTKFIRNTCKIGIACLMCLFSVGMEIYGVSLRVTIDVIVAIAFCIVLKSLKKKGQEIIAIPIATALVTGIMLLDWDGKPAVLVLQVLLSIMCVIWLLVLYDNAISPAWENEKRMPTIILFAITVVIALVSFAVPKILVGELTDNTKMVTALIRIPFLMTCVVMLYDKWVAEMLKQYSIKFDIIAGVCGMAVVCLMVGMTGFVNAMFIAGIVLIGMTPV